MYMGGITHALSNYLLDCGIGAWLRTFGVAALISCTSLSVFYCIFLSFAFGGRSATLLMDHGTMFRLMFGQTRATRPSRKIRERMRQKSVRCVVTSAPSSQFVVSVRSTIVVNVLTPTLVGIILLIQDVPSDIFCC